MNEPRVYRFRRTVETFAALSALLVVAACGPEGASEEPAPGGGSDVVTTPATAGEIVGEATAADSAGSAPLGGEGEGEGEGADAGDGEGEGAAEGDVGDGEGQGDGEGAAGVDSGEEPDAELALVEIYRGEAHGYAIDLPEGWIVDDTADVVIIRSEDDSASPGRDGVPATMTKIDIVPLPGFPLDLQARVEQIRGELEAITEEEHLTLIGGEQAVWLRGRGLMTNDTGIVVTIVGGELYQLQSYGNPEPLKAIAFTFRSTE